RAGEEQRIARRNWSRKVDQREFCQRQLAGISARRDCGACADENDSLYHGRFLRGNGRQGSSLCSTQRSSRQSRSIFWLRENRSLHETVARRPALSGVAEANRLSELR